MRLLVFPIMLLAGSIAAAATVYKWVDENGVTHYSDQPHPGAKTIELESAQTYTTPQQPRKAAAASSAREPARPVYNECAIFRPAQEEVLFNVSTVTAKLRVDPELRPGDSAFVALDGRVIRETPMQGGEFTLNSVYRGTHTVSAIVEDLGGNILCQADPVTFHVRQASVLAPQSPTRAKPPAKPPGKP